MEEINVDTNADGEVVSQQDRKTLLLFSDDLDRVLATFVIANGAAAMDSHVTIFFAFWGINVLRKESAFPLKKDLLARLFGWMMPKGAKKLRLSKMHMFGVGTSMMKNVMQKNHVLMVPELIASARSAGVRFVVCTMSMDVMSITQGELMDGIEFGGIASFLDAADGANMTLFI
jgi:peroxiredoxin family protein